MGSTENFCLRWNDFESNVSGAFRDLRAEADFFDVTLSCTDSNGRSLQAHKVILSACSSFFKSLLRQQTTQNSHPNPFIYLRGVSFSDLSSVLDFMYHGEVNVAQEDLNSFLSVAEELQIKGLTNRDGRPSSGEPSKDRKSHSGPGRPGGGGPPIKRQRRSSTTPNSSVLSSQNAKSNLSSGDIRPADIKSDPDNLRAGPSSSGHVQSSDPAVTDYEDGDNQGDFDESFNDDYYNDNGGEGGEGVMGEDMAGGGSGDGSEEGTVKGRLRRPITKLQATYTSQGLKITTVPAVDVSSSSPTVPPPIVQLQSDGSSRSQVTISKVGSTGCASTNDILFNDGAVSMTDTLPLIGHIDTSSSIRPGVALIAGNVLTPSTSSGSGDDDEHLLKMLNYVKGEYVCKICGKKSNRRDNMKRHVENLHIPKVLQCKLCRIQVRNRQTFYRHMKSKHGISKIKEVEAYKIEPKPGEEVIEIPLDNLQGGGGGDPMHGEDNNSTSAADDVGDEHFLTSFLNVELDT